MNKGILYNELRFKAVKSSGSGGQHVNKVSSKIELSFCLNESAGLSKREKEYLHKGMGHKLTKKGVLQLSCSKSRSQHKNKELVVIRFFELIQKNIKPLKPRKATKPTRASVQKRIENKKRHALKKTLRNTKFNIKYGL